MAMTWVWKGVKVLTGILVFLLGLVGISLVAIVISIHFFDINEHRHIIEQQFNKKSGFKLSLKGNIDIKLSPVPTFDINNVSLQMTAFDEPLLLSADKMTFKVKPRSFFSSYMHLYDMKGTNVLVSINLPAGKFEQKFDKFSGDVNTAPCAINFKDLDVEFDHKKLTGDISLFTFSDKTKVEAKLASPYWEAHSGETVDYLGALLQDKVHGKVTWYFNSLVLNQLKFKDVTWSLGVKEQDIKLNGQGEISGAKFKTEAKLSELKTTPHADLELDLDVIKPAEFLKTFWDKPLISTEGLKLQFKGKATGKSLAEMKDSFTGMIEGKSSQLKFSDATDETPCKRLALQDIDFELAWKERLELTMTGRLPDGGFNLKAWISALKSTPQILTELHIKSQNAAGLFQMIAPSWKLSGGSFQCDLQGKTSGSSVSEWLGKFKGHTFLHIKDMSVFDQKIDARLIDVFALMSSAFNGTQDTVFECLAARFHINEGVLITEENFAVETPDLYALGTGKIDIPGNLMNLAFQIYPRSKTPLKPGSYDNAVSIKGPLNDPKVSASAHGLVAKGSSLALGIATGGISTLAETFLNMVKDRSSPCAKVLDGKKKGDQQSSRDRLYGT